MIAEVEQHLRTRVGKFVFGTDEETLENAFVALLRGLNATVALTEAGIGDAVSRRLKTTVEGATVTAHAQVYENPDEVRVTLGLPAGTSLQEIAVQCARTVCNQFGATVGIAVLCYPQMDENADSEQGSAVAVYTSEKSRSRVYGFGGQFDTAKAWVSGWALANAWRLLREKYNLS
jgi:hypothetical protein